MTPENVTTLEQLLAQADEQINYPFEEILEKYVPFADHITDYVCLSVIMIEDMVSGKLGAEKKKLVTAELMKLWAGVPIPFFLRPFLDPLFEVAVSVMIDGAVTLLNKLFPKGWIPEAVTEGLELSLPIGAP